MEQGLILHQEDKLIIGNCMHLVANAKRPGVHAGVLSTACIVQMANVANDFSL